MRTPKLVLLALALAPLASLVAGCGDTLVDHNDTAIRDQGNGGPSCTQLTCDVNGVASCVPENLDHCGNTCLNCNTDYTPPNGANRVCSVTAGLGSGVCSFECTGGLLKCGSACCGASALSAGTAHTCAITTDARLLCWGRNAEGQVTGTPTAAPVLTPHEVFASGVTAVATGTAHTCATVSGTVRCIGSNANGEAPASQGVNAVELVAGDKHTCARESSGRVTCWGAATLGQSGGGTPITSGAVRITAGADHTCALLTSGAVQCWGTNVSGELGTGSEGGSSTVPQTPLGLTSGIAAVGAGAHHTCAATGTQITPLRCWGANPVGANGPVLPGLAEPAVTSPAEPTKGGNSLVRFDVALVAGGRMHTCIERSAESVKCFGADNSAGQVGVGLANELADSPTPLPAPNPTLLFAIGGDHGCVAAPDSAAVSCWGSNAFGQLGDGTTITPPVGGRVPVLGR